jgi:hypothetical protein
MTFARTIPTPEQRQAEKDARLAVLCALSRSLHRGSYGGSTSGEADTKPASYRDPALLKMARGRPCLLLVPGVCNHRLDTTVAAHENEGKGMGIKAPDNRSVWACYACHSWYDSGTAPRAYKREVFAAAMQMQEQEWEEIVLDKTEHENVRWAARCALDDLHGRGNTA